MLNASIKVKNDNNFFIPKQNKITIYTKKEKENKLSNYTVIQYGKTPTWIFQKLIWNWLINSNWAQKK